MLIHVPVTPEMLQRADEMAEAVGHLSESETNGMYKSMGAIAELACVQYLNAELVNDIDYDLLYRGKKIDVKSVKTHVVPNYTHNGNVFANNTVQAADYYLFTRVMYRNDKPSAVYLMAYMRPQGYYKKANLIRAGTISGGFHARFDMYSLEYRRMLDPNRMLRPDWPEIDSMQKLLTEARDTARVLVNTEPSEARDNAVNTVKTWT
jgi:hypothetical protein